jgi:hypothetical protein
MPEASGIAGLSATAATEQITDPQLRASEGDSLRFVVRRGLLGTSAVALPQT